MPRVGLRRRPRAARRDAHAQGRLSRPAPGRPGRRRPRHPGPRHCDPRADAAGGRRVSAALNRTFLSLKVPNYRRYFSGQVVSLVGNWMQIVAEMWLVVKLTGSGVSVGVTAALQFLPMLLFGALGGVLADRMDKRRLLMVTQTLMAIPALT